MIKILLKILKGEKMKQQRIILLLVLITIVLVTFLTAGVGYAITDERSLNVSDSAKVSPDQGNFEISFHGKPSCVGTGTAKVNITGPTTAVMNIRGLKKAGDYVLVSFHLKNHSHDIFAQLEESVINTNTEYFKVTAELSNSIIKPRSNNTLLKIRVQLIKTPMVHEEKAHISVKVNANPIYY